MAPPFVIPDSLRDLEEEEIPDEDDRLCAHDVIQIETLSPSEIDELVKGVAFDLADKELFCVEEQNVFDQIYSLVRGFSCLEPAAKGNLIESLRSNFSVLLPNIASLSRSSPSHPDGQSLQERINSHRNALKIYTYFLQTIILAEESQPESQPQPRTNNAKGKSSRKKHVPQSWNWEAQRSKIISILATAVETDLKQLYGQSDPEENFLAFVAKGAFAMLENPALLKDKDTKDALCRIIGACATKYHYTMQSSASILHLIHKYEFLPQHIADAVAQAEKKYADGSLAISLIREIGRMNPKDYARDASGAENVGRFLVELADRSPKLMSTNVGMLMPHFGGESYKIRSSLVGVFGKLIAKAFKDTDSNSSSGTHRLRSKQAMLDVLLDRCRDVSAYTRSRVLQTWGELCEEHAVSMGLWNQVSEIAAGRLEDKSAVVRKSALNLLTTLLQYNPFGPQLRTSTFEATLEKYKEKLDGMFPPSNSNSNEVNDVVVKTESPENEEGDGDNDSNGSATEENPSLEENVEMVENCVVDVGPSQSNVEDSGPSQVENQVDINDRTPDVGSLEQTRALVASLEAGVRFAKCMSSTMPILVQLLASPIATDVEHGIQFLMRCRQFQIDGAETCLRKMLPLAFSQEKAIYDAVEGAFISIYIKKNSMETAANLINITIDASIGDLAALEHIVTALVTKGDITSGTISALWDFFTFNVNGVTAEQSRGALSVLCMAAKSSPKVLSSRLLNIIDIGFGRWAKEEPLLARTACIALQRLSVEDRESLVSVNRRVFNVLQSLTIGPGLPEQSWYAAAEQAINAIYALHPMPEMFLADVIRKFHGSVFGQTEAPEQVVPHVENEEDVASLPNGPLSVQVTKLSRYMFVVSHVAMKHLVYIESCVRKVRKQKADKERAAAESQAAKLDDIDATQSSEKASEENNINAELGVSASEDARLDLLAEKAEKEIVSGNQNQKFIIGVCAPVIAKLCRNFTLLQQFPGLQASAMLALCKLMVVDAEFCDANLQLLFTVAQNAVSESVRSNCTIALGDLAVRFPNLMDPWTENMYARLNDQALSVRKNAVLVLSHLILNDMMKVKGYISEMALRLEDEDLRISNLVKLFFHELSKKGNNPVYNLLPDILSRLSRQNISQEMFCNIMQVLIGSIKKDKQMEGLIEKLCHRFSGITDKKQCVDIAYCLSQLTYTEKGYKKLVDLFKSYEHALSEDAVIEYFKSITNKAKKFAKPELKSSIEDFEEKLAKCHEERKEQERTMQNAMAHQQKVAGPMESENSNLEETSCVTECEAQEGLLQEDKVDESRSQERTRNAVGDVETDNLAACEPADVSDSGNKEVESNMNIETSPIATKSCRKGRSREKLKKSLKLEVLTTTDEDNSHAMDSQTSPARVRPERLIPNENSSVTFSSQDRGGEVESDPRGIIYDPTDRSEITPLDTESVEMVGKGMSRRKKATSFKIVSEEPEGTLIDEEKENKSRQVPQTPLTRSVRKTRQKDKVPPPSTRSLRKR
jgi:condensin complex subunit 1